MHQGMPGGRALEQWRATLLDLWHELVELEVASDETPPGSPARRAARARLDRLHPLLMSQWTHYHDAAAADGPPRP